MRLTKKWNKKEMRRYLLLAMLVALFSELHFYPIDGGPRLSLGVVALYAVALIREDIGLSQLALLSGSIIWVERLTTRILFLGQSIESALLQTTPAFVFYIAFSVIYHCIALSKIKKRYVLSIGVMTFVDVACNSFEAIMRQGFTSNLFQIFVAAGIFRALMAYTLYYMWQRQSLFIRKQEHQKRYVQLTELVANLETELFYLKKSSDQIERVMHLAYTLYDKVSESSEHKEQALEIAREIHEIKKDYLRVISGFKDFYTRMENVEQLNLSEILAIVRSSGEKIILDKGLNINITYTYEVDVAVKEYLKIFTILNNLIDNSIGAIGNLGWIHLEAKPSLEHLQFVVSDNGIGIEEAYHEVIFYPGFTTKYDEVTGEASTGIGLSHVKNLVEELGGEIYVQSTPQKGTTFFIHLPFECQRRTP